MDDLSVKRTLSLYLIVTTHSETIKALIIQIKVPSQNVG